MIFKNVTSLSIPEGVVTRITSGGVILWEKQSGNHQDIYQRVDYITSDGNQYFITDFIANNESGMELTASFPVVYHEQVPMGSCISTTTGLFYVPYPMSDTSCYYGFNTGGTISHAASNYSKLKLQTNFCNDRRIRIYEEGFLAVTQNISTTLTQQTSPVGIFACTKGDGSVGESRKLDLYGAKISQGSEVVREYIPCYRKSDNVVGVYEIYTNKFLTNSGSGEFEIGNEIDW